ncbi:MULTISPECIES: type I restriction-modification enzyme R subunit C-terminal domain-containing protein [Methanosarcina]
MTQIYSIYLKQSGTLKFNEDQMNWLCMIKDYVATRFYLEIDDLDYTPFDALGGRGRMYQLFWDEMNSVIN